MEQTNNSRLLDLNRTFILEEIARRVHYLTLLYSVDVATYRQVLNEDSVTGHPSASDYTRYDYNYVAITRKNHHDCVQALIDLPGPKLTHPEIDAVINEYHQSGHIFAAPLYTLSETRNQLQCTPHVTTFLHLIVEDLCPRTNKMRLCFSIALLKDIIPDLMGDGTIAPFCLTEKEEDDKVLSIGPCIVCHSHKRSHIFMPCHHVLVCHRCSDSIQNTVCPLCKQAIVNTEKIYT